MKGLKITLFISGLTIFQWCSAQFSVDLFSAQLQTGASEGTRLQNGFVNVLVPIKLKTEHVFLARLTYEYLKESNDSISSQLQNLAVPLGMNWKLSESNRLTTLVIPKFSGEDLGASHEIFQCGFYGFFQHQQSPDFRYRFGVYYNREFFGNFFVPLVGVDWKINEKLSLYGTLPNSMKLMYSTSDGYSLGIAFRSLMRSYRLNLTDPNAFVRFNENQLKLVNEIRFNGNWILQADIGYFITKAPLMYEYGKRKEVISSDLFKSVKPFPMLNVGLVYRIPAN